MSLTKIGEMSIEGITIVVDEDLPKPPINEAGLNFRERYAKLDKYLNPILKATRLEKPVSIGVFGGRRPAKLGVDPILGGGTACSIAVQGEEC